MAGCNRGKLAGGGVGVVMDHRDGVPAAAGPGIGLSFADRACLATAKIEGIPVLTANRIWANLDLDLDIRCIG